MAIETLGFDMVLQWKLLAYSIIIGCALGVLFDVLRISRVFLAYPEPQADRSGRKLQKASEFIMTIVSLIEDILFFVVSALTIVLFVFHTNHGNARGFILAGALGGFIFYINTIGRLTMLCAGAICRFTRWLASLLYKKLILPIARLIAKIAGWIYKTTIGRVASRLDAMRRAQLTRLAARELTRFCAAIDVKTKGYTNESGTTFHSGKARNLSRISLYDHNSRERADQVQHPRRRTRKTRDENRRRAG